MARAVTNSRRSEHNIMYVRASFTLAVRRISSAIQTRFHSVQSTTNTIIELYAWTDPVSYPMHHATFDPAATARTSNLRSLKERVVTQHLQSGTVYPNPSLLTFCVSLLLNIYYKLSILINDIRFCPHLRFFTIVNDFNVRHQPGYDNDND